SFEEKIPSAQSGDKDAECPSSASSPPASPDPRADLRVVTRFGAEPPPSRGPHACSWFLAMDDVAPRWLRSLSDVARQALSRARPVPPSRNTDLSSPFAACRLVAEHLRSAAQEAGDKFAYANLVTASPGPLQRLVRLPGNSNAATLVHDFASSEDELP